MERVGIIGSGLRGARIAEVCARASLETVVVEVSDETAKAAGSRVRTSVDRAASRGKINEEVPRESSAQSTPPWTWTRSPIATW